MRIHPSIHKAVAALAVAAFIETALLCVTPAHAWSNSVHPDGLGAKALFDSIERECPGALDYDAWLLIEKQLEVAGRAQRERVAPLGVALDRLASAQLWLNWPSIKGGEIRRALRALQDEQRAVDREFGDALIPALSPTLGGAVRRALDERARRLEPVWPLLHAQVPDLVKSTSLILAEPSLDPGIRAQIGEILSRWSEWYGRELDSQREATRVAFDHLERAMLDAGIDPAQIPSPKDEWMTPFFEAWEKDTPTLAERTRHIMQGTHRALNEILALLPRQQANDLRYEVLRSAYNLEESRDAPFAAAVRLRRLTDAERREIVELRESWREEDSKFVLTQGRAMERDLPSYCPLLYAGWGPADRYASLRDRWGELRHERQTIRSRFNERLRLLLGADSDLAAIESFQGLAQDDPRLTPWPERVPSREAPSPAIRPVPGIGIFRGDGGPRGWLDPGSIATAELSRVARWIGLGEREEGVLLDLAQTHLARRAELAIPEARDVATAWTFDTTYHYDDVLGDRILAMSVERLQLLLEQEKELWGAAEALAESPGGKMRARMVAAARRSQCQLAGASSLLWRWHVDHRGEALLAAAVIEEVLDAPAALSPEVDAALAATETSWAKVVDLAEQRRLIVDAFVRQGLRLLDGKMWLREERQREATARLLDLVRQTESAGSALRQQCVAEQEALAAALTAVDGEAGVFLRRAVARWRSTAQPMSDSADLGPLRLLDSDLQPGDLAAPTRARLEATRTRCSEEWNALVSAMRSRAERVTVEMMNDPEAMQRLNAESRAFEDALGQIAERAAILRTLAMRPVNATRLNGVRP